MSYTEVSTNDPRWPWLEMLALFIIGSSFIFIIIGVLWLFNNVVVK